MNRSLQIRAGLSAVAVLLAIYGLLPTFKSLSISHAEREAAKANPTRLAEIEAIDAKAIRRGLDLKGGMYLVLEVDQTNMDDGQAADALQRVKEILYNRIDKFGVSEPEITTFGSNRIVVKLPGLQDPERAKGLIGKTARLEFRLVRQPDDLQDALTRLDQAFAGTVTTPAAAPGDSALVPDQDQFLRDHPFSGLVMTQAGITSTPLFVAEENVDRVQAMLDDPRTAARLRGMEFQFGMDPMNVGGATSLRPLYLVDAAPIISGDQLTDALSSADNERPGLWQVTFTLNNRGAREFGRATGENVGRFLAISLDGRISSAPVIQSRITSTGSITGNFTNAEANDLALLLRAGALPTDITIAEERTVGPSLGSDSIRMGVNASMWGALLVVVFMLVYYRLSGVVAVVALTANILILLAVLAQFDLVLTLPGLAGVALTVGMAVDANVLINERIREELRKDKTIRAAVQAGYQNATRTIIDSNVTTLIAGGVLLWFGTGPVKGFAVTMCIGILTSMFTALVMTHAIMDVVTQGKGKQKLSI
jgi:protein-export membrane protein SecD